MDAMDGSCGIFLIQSCPNGPANCNAPTNPPCHKIQQKKATNLQISVAACGNHWNFTPISTFESVRAQDPSIFYLLLKSQIQTMAPISHEYLK